MPFLYFLFVYRDEELFLTSMLAELKVESDVWVGMKFDPVLLTYKWLSGHPVTYTHWYNKQPDPRLGNYVKVGLQKGSRKFMFWKPAARNETLPFFCQRMKGISLKILSVYLKKTLW